MRNIDDRSDSDMTYLTAHKEKFNHYRYTVASTLQQNFPGVQSSALRSLLQLRIFPYLGIEINPYNKDVIENYHATPLHMAASEGKALHDQMKTYFSRRNLLTLLLLTGAKDLEVRANVRSRSHAWNEVTPLMIATTFGSINNMKILLDNGANIDHESTKTGESALMVATKKLNVNAVKLLLERGADVNATDNIGFDSLRIAKSRMTPTSNAVQHRIMKLLKDHGAKPNDDQMNFSI